MTSNQNKNWLPILLIAGSLAAWGALLGLGAYLAPVGEAAGADPRKLGVVAATTGGFLLFWGLALAFRATKLRRQRLSKADPGSPSGDKSSAG